MSMNQCLLVSETCGLFQFLNETTFQVSASVIKVYFSTDNVLPGFLLQLPRMNNLDSIILLMLIYVPSELIKDYA